MMPLEIPADRLQQLVVQVFHQQLGPVQPLVGTEIWAIAWSKAEMVLQVPRDLSISSSPFTGCARS